MDYFTSKMMYEDSARVRDQLKAINSFKVGQRKLEADFSNRDVIGYQNKDKHFVVVILRIREGRILSREKISLDSDESIDNILRSVVINFYMNAAYIPNKIYFPELPEESKELESWLSEKAERKVVFHVPQRAVKLQELKLANTNWLVEVKNNILHLNLALNLAKNMEGLTGTNPSVGSVLVKNDEVISLASTGYNGTPHSEFSLLNKIDQFPGKHHFEFFFNFGHFEKWDPVKCRRFQASMDHFTEPFQTSLSLQLLPQ